MSGFKITEITFKYPNFICTIPNSEQLAENVSKIMNIPYIVLESKKFQNGENYYRIPIIDYDTLVGTNVIIVASITNDNDLLSVQRIGTYLSSRCASIRFVIPYLGYSTMEREVKPGEVITAYTNTLILDSIPSAMRVKNIFLLFDLHCTTIKNFFRNSTAFEVYYNKLLIEEVERLLKDYKVEDFDKAQALRHPLDDKEKYKNVIFGSADLGRPLWVESFAKHFGTEIAFINKHRVFESIKTDDTPIGNVKGSHVIIYDDMLRSGTTILQAIDTYINNGAKSVDVVISHCGVINEEVLRKFIEHPHIKHIITTNSHPNAYLIDKIKKEMKSKDDNKLDTDKFKIIDISRLIVDKLNEWSIN